MDTPYWVEHRTKPADNGQSLHSTWAIRRSGMDDLCWTDDVTWAYRLCDLLNREHGSVDSPSSGTPTCRPGSRAPT
jgi:hypothetical protein